MDSETFARLCLDPARLTALGRAAEGSLDVDSLVHAAGIRRREALEIIAELRLANLLDDDGALIHAELRAIARTLPRPEEASAAITAGEWTDAELRTLRAFFQGGRLTAIPAQRGKRRIVLERIAQDFEPGVRYDEPTVNERIQIYNDDYAAIRRYLVDDEIMTRADGVYWRSGGRVPPDLDPETGATPEQPARSTDRGPVLRTEHPDITLMPFTGAHRDGLLQAADDERIARHMTNEFHYPYTGDDADAWISKCTAEDPPINFVILVSGNVTGGVGCEPHHDINTGTAEMGWWLAPRWWGRGIAAIAVARLVEYCFRDLDLHRVEAGVFLNNPASARVADKAGFILEGIARDGYLKDGQLVDRLYYGLARSSRDGAGTAG